MKKYIIILIVSICLCISCENEIKYKIDEKVPTLIMNAFINADSLQNKLYLGFTGKTVVNEVNNATVEVKVNGELKEYPIQKEENLYVPPRKYFSISTKFNPGDVVRIDTHTSDGKYHAWIEEKVPFPIDILNVDTNTVFSTSGVSSYRYKQLRMKVYFKDRIKEKNYYRIVVEQVEALKGKIKLSGLNRDEYKDTIIYRRTNDYWPWEDVVLTDGRPATVEELDNDMFERVKNIYGVFDDSRFQDSNYTMLVRSSLAPRWIGWGNIHFTPDLLDMHIVIKLQSITENEYYYLSALNIIDSDILDDYISDPIKIPGNVYNGTGIVAINTADSYIIEIVKDKPIEHFGEGYEGCYIEY